MRIIPAIDIIDGKAVRLEKGDFLKKKVYADDPVDVAQMFMDAGLHYLHLVDLDGAKVGTVQHQKILEKIKRSTSLIVDYGGGIRNTEDVQSLQNAGADQVNIGSLAVKDVGAVLSLAESFGPEYIVLSPDVIDKKIAIHGWQEASEMGIMEFIKKYKEAGFSYFVCTDIAKDGMLRGSSIGLYKDILKEIAAINLIASGGVANIDELENLSDAGLEGVIIGKAIYEGRISLKALETFILKVRD